MAKIQPVLLVQTGSGGTSTFVGVAKLSIEWGLSAPEAMSYEGNGGNLGVLTPGSNPSGTRIISFSLDNGTNTDARMLSGGSQVNTQMPNTVTESGKSIGAALEMTHIPRASAQQIKLIDAYKGIRGSVSTSDTATAARMLTGGIIPYFQGIEATKIAVPAAQAANFAFTWVFPDSTVANLPLDIDINRDTLDRATLSTAEHLGSAVDPQKAQYVIDSGDYGVAGGARTVTVGNLGTSARCTFQDYASDGTAQPILFGEGTTVAPQTLQMLASASLIGGDTHHGLPASGKMTDIVTINQTLDDATGNYASGMAVVSFYGDRNHGGVYYWPGDGIFHPCSQAMGVNSLWYSETGSSVSSVPLIFAATDAGVYSQVADPAGASPIWPRLGKMAQRCLKVIQADATYVLAEIAAPGGQIAGRHILKYDPNNAVNGFGFDDYVDIYSNGGLFDFGIIDNGSKVDLYTLSTDAPGFFHYHSIDGSASDQTISIPGESVGTGMDTVVSYNAASGGAGKTNHGVYLRTDSGSTGLYLITTPATPPAVGTGLTDAQHAPVMVNSVAAHSAGTVQWDGVASVPVVVHAATSAGLFVSGSYTGPWKPTDGQSNMGDIDIKRAASSPPRGWSDKAPPPLADPPKRMLTRFYGISDRALFVSNDGTISWVDALQKPLDEGPYFFAQTKANTGFYPTNNTTSVAVGAYTLIRMLDGLSQFTYRLVNPTSTAPAGAHRDAELSYISAAAYVPEVPLSEQLVRGAARLLQYTAAGQTIVEMVSWFDDDADALRFLRPTHMVNINGTIQELIVGVSSTPQTLVTFVNTPFYVLKHRIEYDVLRGGCFTFTRLGILCLDDRTDASRVTSDLFYQISRDTMYRSRGHH